MVIDKITVQKVFPLGPYMNVKIGLEGSIGEHEDVKQAITEGEELLNDWFKNRYPNISQSPNYGDEYAEDLYSGPLPPKKPHIQHGRASVLMPPPPDIKEKYEAAERDGNITTMRSLEKIYKF